ncbi:tetratricopeptide repeat protein [Flavisolibacter ginsengisoli]|jgi:hypothetical protein|uniref:Uncharacterized protein n=1 Tax=Flavisolibacter ginsengisoli DSM 18119 TaxID=1121884 RepID=A0A1M5GEP9_9BACT|nr:hypothetical protein [Flavisolibacter ginsengisoli]SHG02197.1 hypothetical protein SAMN02745131_04130 [Flavisolibacter ginsengisoli DSM 18119]
MNPADEIEPSPEPIAANVCRNCQAALPVMEGKIPLCQSCRSQFINFPIPKWIRAFGAGILLLLVFSLVSLPEQIRTGVHLQKGIKAASDHHYYTAQKELQQVVDHEPYYTEAQCRLLIAAFFNEDYKTVFSTYKMIENNEVKDQDLFKDVTDVLNRMETHLPTDSFNLLLEKKQGQLTETDYRNYFDSNAHDAYALTRYANLLYDQKNFAGADSVLNLVLKDNPFHTYALIIKIPLKRDQLQFDSSYYFINQLLALNKEDAYAIASRARTLLKQHKDGEAFKDARQSLDLNPSSPYGLATMALIYHYRNDIPKRDALMARAQKDSSLMESFDYVSNIVSGKEKFRD